MDQLYEEYVGIHLKSKKFIDSLADWGQLLKEEKKWKNRSRCHGEITHLRSSLEGVNQALADFSDIEVQPLRRWS